MQVATYEGRVVNGAIRLDDNVILPENCRVIVILPDIRLVSMPSVRLVNPKDAAALKMEFVDEDMNDKV